MFKVEVHIPPDEWGGNALRFKTRQQADQYGLELLSRWTQPDDYRIVEDLEAKPGDYLDSGMKRF